MPDNPVPTKAPVMIFRPIIGIIYLLGSFGVFTLVLMGKTDVLWKDVALMIVGALIAKSGTIVDWSFGSSQSSNHKTEIMADTAKQNVQEAKQEVKEIKQEAKQEVKEAKQEALAK